MKLRVLAGVLLYCTLRLSAQDADADSTRAGYVPTLSGGLGYIHNVNGGKSTLSPAINPVLLLPLGSHVLVESRAGFVGVFQRRNGIGDYTGQVFSGIDYVQGDWLANTHAIVVGGKYIVPFGLYSERLVPIWIATFQDLPIDYSIGTRTTGAGVGGEVRGIVRQTNSYSVQYAAYYSAHSNVYLLSAARTTGFDSSVYFPNHRVEVGVSYQRYLDKPSVNSEAAYVSWQPPQLPLDIKAEYDRTLYAQGYWIQASYMLSQVPIATAFFRNVELAGRMQQYFPRHGGGNGFSTVAQKRPEVGLNYYLRDNWRIVSSYERRYAQGKDTNVWYVGFTYRFLFPLWPGRE